MVTPHAIRSQRVLIDDAFIPATVVWQGEQISSIEAVDQSLPADVAVSDVGTHAVMAGLVDTHVHINEPGRTEWEGFDTATRAAAAGGVTTVVDMPLNCLPVTTTVDALKVKEAACAPSLWVDTGFWGGVIEPDLGALEALAKSGILGAKAFLCDSGIAEFPEVDGAVLRSAMEILGAAGLPLLAHAEIDLGSAGAPVDRTYQSFLASRPAAWEEAAIALLIDLCRQTGCPVHIVHLSAASALPAIAAAKAEGLPVTVETCPHYLILAAEDIDDGHTEFKCAPPIRERANRDDLWRGLEAGVIDMVTTDHSPCTPALKARGTGSFAEAWGGISSLQLGLPLVWAAASARGFSLVDMARWMSAMPARLSNLSSRKGRLAPGMDADLVVLDPDEEGSVRSDALLMRHRLTPYEGLPVRGRVIRTILRGQAVVEDGEICGTARGRILAPGRRRS